MRHFFLLLSLLAAPLAQAQILDEYQASVSVPDQGAAARDKGLRDALEQVLVRVGGPGAAAHSAPILARASTLIRSVGYQTGDNNQLQLLAVFEPQSVDNALKAQGLPVHGVLAGEAEDVILSVSGIESAQGYARVLNHLRAQPGVRHFAVLGADGNTLTASMRVEGGGARLAGALGIGGVLKRDPGGATPLSFILKP